MKKREVLQALRKCAILKRLQAFQSMNLLRLKKNFLRAWEDRSKTFRFAQLSKFRFLPNVLWLYKFRPWIFIAQSYIYIACQICFSLFDLSLWQTIKGRLVQRLFGVLHPPPPLSKEASFSFTKNQIIMRKKQTKVSRLLQVCTSYTKSNLNCPPVLFVSFNIHLSAFLTVSTHFLD